MKCLAINAQIGGICGPVITDGPEPFALGLEMDVYKLHVSLTVTHKFNLLCVY